MPTVRVDEEVFQALKKLAEPFVDSPNSVIRRLLEEKGVVTKAPATAAPETSRSPASTAGAHLTLTPQSTYERYLLAILDRQFSGRGHKRDVTQAVIEQMRADGLIGPADLELVATGETKAENSIAWGRNALKERGHISRISIRGIWELTQEGKDAAKKVSLPTR